MYDANCLSVHPSARLATFIAPQKHKNVCFYVCLCMYVYVYTLARRSIVYLEGNKIWYHRMKTYCSFLEAAQPGETGYQSDLSYTAIYYIYRHENIIAFIVHNMKWSFYKVSW